MKIKITIDYDDSGLVNPLLQGLDIELDFKEDTDQREAKELAVDALRKILTL